MSKSICTECSHKLRCDAADLRGGDTAITRCYGFTNGGFTNADRIRAMSDKKLAYYLNNVETDGRVYGPQGEAYWLDWLRQEATQKDGGQDDV